MEVRQNDRIDTLQHINLSSRWRHELSFYFNYTRTPEEEQQGTEEQQKRSLICVSEWSECVVKVIMDEVTGAQLIAEALKSQVCVVLSYASFLGSQSFSCK